MEYSRILRRLVVCLAMVIGLANCGGGGGGESGNTTTNPTDTVPLSVIAISPNDGETNVLGDSDLTISFSENIDPATVDSATILIRDSLGFPVLGDFTCNGPTVTFTPEFGLSRSAIYTMTVTLGVTSFEGHAVASEYSCSFSTTPVDFAVIAPNTTEPGELGPPDAPLPDYSYADFYTFTLDSTAEVTLRLEADFDAYLVLFDGIVASIPNVADWVPYKLAENDDMAVGVTDSEITITLNPGDYVILANTFWSLEVGAYTLTFSVPSL